MQGPEADFLVQLLSSLQALVHRWAGWLGWAPSLVYGLSLALPLAAAYGLQRLRGRGRRRWTPAALQALGDREFEELIARLWARLGYRTAVTPVGPDRGIDVLAERPRWSGLLGRERLAIQAKRYKAGHKVTLEQVMQYAAIPLRDPTISGVIIVTSGEFTRTAREEGLRLKTIRALVDGRRLAEMLNRYVPFPTRARRLLLPLELLLLAAALLLLGAWITDPQVGSP